MDEDGFPIYDPSQYGEDVEPEEQEGDGEPEAHHEGGSDDEYDDIEEYTGSYNYADEYEDNPSSFYGEKRKEDFAPDFDDDKELDYKGFSSASFGKPPPPPDSRSHSYWETLPPAPVFNEGSDEEANTLQYQSPYHAPPAHDAPSGEGAGQEFVETCIVCDTNNVNCILEPCGEVVFCISCITKIKKNSGCCPRCGVRIERIEPF